MTERGSAAAKGQIGCPLTSAAFLNDVGSLARRLDWALPQQSPRSAPCARHHERPANRHV